MAEAAAGSAAAKLVLDNWASDKWSFGGKALGDAGAEAVAEALAASTTLTYADLQSASEY